jgi:hypothetical protein
MKFKICKKHGKLSQENIFKDRRGCLVCKICRKSYSDEWRAKNKEKTLEKCIRLRNLAKENKLEKICNIHGIVTDILINNRACMLCGICEREKSLLRYHKEKSIKPKTEYAIRIEEKKKGNCIIHGENTRRKSGNNPCKICQKTSKQIWLKNNPDKVKEINEKRRLIANGFRHKENTRKRLEIRKNKDIDGYNKIMAEKAKKYREQLPDAYIKQVIKNQRIFKKDGVKIPIDAIPQELIDIKRIHIKLKNKLKEGKK